MQACLLCAVTFPVHASGSEQQISDLAVHLEAVRMRLASGQISTAKAALTELQKRHPTSQIGLVDAVQLGLLLSRVGADAAASRYFRVAAARIDQESELDALERSSLAAAIYAIGKPEAAMAILSRCRARWPARRLRCRPWEVAQVAASKDDWAETARILDTELLPTGEFTLKTGQTAPIRVLKLRQKAAWHGGDKLEIGRWRAILIRRGVRPDETSRQRAAQRPEQPLKPRKSGLMWIVMSLTLVLLAALLLARRSAGDEA